MSASRIVVTYELPEYQHLDPAAVTVMFERAKNQARQIGGTHIWPTMVEFRIEDA